MAVYPYESAASNELAGPWRRAALVAVGIAAVELVVLIVLVAALVATPLAHRVHRHASATATAVTAPATYAPATRAPAAPAHVRPSTPVLPRSRIRILVLNGNGRQGAAGAEASTLRARGYRISATGNAGRSDYAASIVMYEPGFDREAHRLARDESIRIVAPMDGVRHAALKGAQLALVVGS